jgi:hypothetical protein
MAAGSGMTAAALLSISLGVSWSCARLDEIVPGIEEVSNE